jgi:hypothetical protein
MQYEYNQIRQLMETIQNLTEELEIVDEILESVFEDDDSMLMEEEKKKWIQNAIKKEGALHKQLKVKKGEKIPAKKLEKAAEKGGKIGKRARLAITLRKLNKKKKELKEAADIMDEHDGLVQALKTNGERMHPEERKMVEARIKELKQKYHTNVIDAAY